MTRMLGQQRPAKLDRILARRFRNFVEEHFGGDERPAAAGAAIDRARRGRRSDRILAAAGGEKTDVPLVFINPVLSNLSTETDVRDEGCLSFPGVFISVKRSLKLQLSALDIDGKPFTVDAENFFARAIQHEHDHLVNKLLYDHAGPIKRQMIKRKLDKMTDEEAMDILRTYGD